jgi:hypothetical protein
MERPALQELLEDIKQRRIDVVVLYKVDRLIRPLTDFARLVDLLDENGVSFVSLTQCFDPTSVKGRLTLNVLLSFAQSLRPVAWRGYPSLDRRRALRRRPEDNSRTSRARTTRSPFKTGLRRQDSLITGKFTGNFLDCTPWLRHG